MKKKIMLSVLLICVCVTSFACGKSTFDLVTENMSEWTKVYYYGENEDCYVSLTSGQREQTYLLNGKSEDKTDFALLSISLNKKTDLSLLKVIIKIDGQECEKELENNPLNNLFMTDLEMSLTGQEQIEIVYNQKSLTLSALSNSFAVNDVKAIEIACQNFEEQIKKKKSFNNLNAEMYLRILDKNANNFDGIFWCFTVLNVDNESWSIVISTQDGSILAKTEKD